MVGLQDRSLTRQSIHGLGGVRVIGPEPESLAVMESGLSRMTQSLFGSGQVHVDVGLIGPSRLAWRRISTPRW